MDSTKLGTFWLKWKAKIIAGVAILAALAIAIFAAHQIGYTKGENLSKVAIERYQKEKETLNKQLAEEQAKVDVRTVTEYVTQREVQTKVEYRNRDIIRNIPTQPGEKNLSEGWVYAYNQSVVGAEIDFDLANVTRESKIPSVKALDTIAENNAISNRNSAKLEALQSWIKESEKTRNEVTD